MDRSAGIKVEGAARLRRTLRQAGDDLGDLKSAHAEAANIAAEASASLAPKRTGTLAQTIRGAGTKTAGVLRAGYASVPYAGPIHWGWPARNISPQPFLSDGATSSQGRWLPVYRDAVDDAVRKVRGA